MEIVVETADGSVYMAPDIDSTDLTDMSALTWVGKTSDNVNCPVAISVH
jgi:hypothetical protein